MLGYLCSYFSGGTLSFLQGVAGNHLEDGRCLDVYLAASRNHNSVLQGADSNLDSHTFEHTVFELLSKLVQHRSTDLGAGVSGYLCQMDYSFLFELCLGLFDGLIRSPGSP